MIGCRERSKIASKSSKNARTSAELVFLERKRERERKKTHLEAGPVGPRRPMGAARGQAAPAGRLGHWWPPWSAPGASGSLPAWKFLFLFFWNLSENFTVEIFSKFKKLQNFLKT